MKMFLRILRRVLAVAAILIVLVVAALVVFTHTERFRTLVREKLVSFLNEQYRGHFAVEGLSGGIWGTFGLRNAVISYDNHKVLSIPSIEARYRLIPLLYGRVKITSIVAKSPELNLARARGGEWNIVSAFTERHPSPQAMPVTILIDNVKLESARIAITQSPANIYRLQDVNIAARSTIGPTSTDINLPRLSATLEHGGFPSVGIHGSFAFSDSDGRSLIRIPSLSVETRSSQVQFSDASMNLNTMASSATVGIKRLAASDLNLFIPKLGLAQDISGKIGIAGENPAAARIDAALEAGKSHISAKVLADFAHAQRTYTAQAKLEGVNLRELLHRTNEKQLPGGIINATLQASGHGVDFAALSASGKVEDKNLSVAGWEVGDLIVNANFKNRVATIESTLASNAGSARMQGQINTAGAISYKLTLAVNQLRLHRISGPAGLPEGMINATANIQGTGFDPATMNASARIAVLRSTIGPATVESARVDTGISRGVLKINSVDIRAQNLTASASGNVILAGEGKGNLHYVVRVTRLKPWFAIAGKQGDGSATLTGDASGDPQSLRLSGSAEVSEVSFGNYSIRHGRIAYDLNGIGQPGNFRGKLTTVLTELKAGTDLKSVDIEAQFAPERMAGQQAAAPATLATLNRFSVGTNAGDWALQGPAVIIYQAGEIEFRRFQIANRDQVISVGGSISTTGTQSVNAQVQRIKLADLPMLFARMPHINGLLTARLDVKGTAAAPDVALSSKIDGLQAGQIRAKAFSANLRYSQGRATLAVNLEQDAAHRLDINGTIPARLSWNNGLAYQAAGDMNVTVQSSGINLAFVDAFTGGIVSDTGGTLRINLTVRGPVGNPQPNGTIELTGARMLITQLGVKVEKTSATIAVEPQRIQLTALSASADGGTMTGNGSVELSGFAPQQVRLNVAFNNWPAIHTDRYSAAVAGKVAVAGPVNALMVTGNAEVLWGLFRPDLNLLQGGSLRRDPTIKVVQSWTEAPVGVRRKHTMPNLSDRPTFRNMAINFTTVIHRNTWIKTPDAAVEIDGRVHLTKVRLGKASLSGMINTVRGVANVAGKSFTVKPGHITFTGGRTINPSLDIPADYTTQGYTVTATVSGTADKPQLVLSSVPALSQSDIVAVLMFGKPISQLSTSQQGALQQEAVSLAGGYAAAQLGEAVAESLGLQGLGVSVSQEGVGLGHYLTENLYISASQGTTDVTSRKAAVSYYLTHGLQIDTSASTTQGNEIDLSWKKEY